MDQSQAQTFSAYATVTIIGQAYYYTLHNDEIIGSPLYGTNFSIYLPSDVPFQVTATPLGWAVSTDNNSYLTWSNTDSSLPYPHDIAPGTSLGGFSIVATGSSSNQTAGYSIDAWQPHYR